MELKYDVSFPRVDTKWLDDAYHEVLKRTAKELYERMFGIDEHISLLDRRSSPPYTMGGLAQHIAHGLTPPFIKESDMNVIEEVF